jgi:predicted nucleic-acid-binding protein
LIGLDTSILLRSVLDDDPIQSPAAQRLLQSLDRQRPGYVNVPVILEFFWVLRSRYRLPRVRLSRIMRDLIEVEYIGFEALETIGKALAAYQSGMADFSDSVIAMRNRELGADVTFTFDRDTARVLPSMELLS